MITSVRNSAEYEPEQESVTHGIDLHTHTDSSDGALSARALIEKAAAAGIGTLGICDHDTVSSLEEAVQIAGTMDVVVIPGIEVTSSYRRFQLHFLGYYIDYTDKYFQTKLIELRDARIRRAKRIVAKLNRIKIPLKFETVIEKFGDQGSVGRPHIANTMVEEGYASTYDEVFHKYIGIGRPAYEANHPFPPTDAITMIRSAGGLSFLAHPSHYVNNDLLGFLVKNGLDGIEVVHPSHSDEEIELYRNFAEENSLLKSGGSDFHGGLKNDDANLGRYTIPSEWFDKIMERARK